jgi:hypothetical protein
MTAMLAQYAPDTEASDDLDLVHATRNGDVSAFEQLVKRYDRKLLRIAQHVTHNLEDAQDVVQEAFFKAFQHLDQFREESKFSRLTSIFLRDQKGCRPVFRNLERFQSDPHWRDLLLFHEYFHGDSGAGVGASHQTGWTGLVTKLMQQNGEGTRGETGALPAQAAAD